MLLKNSKNFSHSIFHFPLGWMNGKRKVNREGWDEWKLNDFFLYVAQIILKEKVFGSSVFRFDGNWFGIWRMQMIILTRFHFYMQIFIVFVYIIGHLCLFLGFIVYEMSNFKETYYFCYDLGFIYTYNILIMFFSVFFYFVLNLFYITFC